MKRTGAVAEIREGPVSANIKANLTIYIKKCSFYFDMSETCFFGCGMPDGDIFERRLGKGWRKAFNEIRGAPGHWDDRRLSRFIMEALRSSARSLGSPCLPSVLRELTATLQASSELVLAFDNTGSLRDRINKIIARECGFTRGAQLARLAALKVEAMPSPPTDVAAIKHAFAQAFFKEILHHQLLDRVEDGFIHSMDLDNGQLAALKAEIYSHSVDKMEPLIVGMIDRPGSAPRVARPAKNPHVNEPVYLHAPLEVVVHGSGR